MGSIRHRNGGTRISSLYSEKLILVVHDTRNVFFPYERLYRLYCRLSRWSSFVWVSEGEIVCKNVFLLHLKISNHGECSNFLRIKIEKRPNGLLLSQSAYSTRILESAIMYHWNPTKKMLPLAHPLYEEPKLTTDWEKIEMESVPYRQILGVLLYISTRTCPTLLPLFLCLKNMRLRVDLIIGKY